VVKFSHVRCVICSKFITVLLQSQHFAAVFVINPFEFLRRAAELTVDCSVTEAWRASVSEDHHAGTHVLVSHEFAATP
jgi:hypothetical protein